MAIACTTSATAQDFIKAPNGTYWKIDAGLRRMFTSSESIEGYGFKTTSAVSVNQQQFDAYPVGTPLPERKIVDQTMRIPAQEWGEVRIPVEGWLLIGVPHVENGSQIEVLDILNASGDTIAIKVRSHNPNLMVMGFGQGRTVTVRVTLERR
ncbi:MAG TPA: hypothetical protein VM940_00280 [Chthoniobacterales bacterium]|nr:hypothetical protein [Chthoniobacterales bacterium]